VNTCLGDADVRGNTCVSGSRKMATIDLTHLQVFTASTDNCCRIAPKKQDVINNEKLFQILFKPK